MKIIILTEGPFPYGMAATNRLVAYARGMADSGAEVRVICTKPADTPGQSPVNTRTEGSFNGVIFKYAAGKTVRSQNPWSRLRDYWLGFRNTGRELDRLSGESPVDVVFMGISNHMFTRYFYRWAKRNGALFVQERSEYPFIGISGLIPRIRLWRYLHFTCRYFDAIIVITKALAEYYSKWLREGRSTYLLPMMVEAGRFEGAEVGKPEGLPERYIAYVGSMQGKKDGVPILLESFSAVADEYPDVHLLLIGDDGIPEAGELKSAAREKGLENRVRFTGVLGRDVLPGYLVRAECLALARPPSKQAEGGFPNKLGEYLATGKPVVCTAVSEIPDYLQDGIHAFIARPGDTDSFTRKLREALEDPGRAKHVGAEGRKLTESVFNPVVQAGKMLDYFMSLKREQG